MPEPSGYNKIFFHMSTTGNRTGWGDLVRACDEAGIPVSVHTVGGEGMGDIIAQWDNGSLVPHVPVVRYMPLDGSQDVPPYGAPIGPAATAWWNYQKSRMSDDVIRYHNRVVIKHGNELDKNQADWLGNFFLAVATLALNDPDGPFITAPFGWASGEPEEAHWRTPGMQKYLQFCNDNPAYGWVCVHEYSYNKHDIWDGAPYKVGRFKMLFDVCDSLGLRRPNVVIHEFGWTLDDIPTTPIAMAHIDQVAQEYAWYPQVKGAGIWTTQRYQGTNIKDKVAALIPHVQALTINNRYHIGPTDPPVEPPVEPPIDPPVEPPVEPPVDPPGGIHKVVVLKIAQEHTKHQWELIGGVAHDDSKRTQTASHDDAESMYLEGNAESYIRVIDPGLPSQASAIEYFESKGYKYELVYMFTKPYEPEPGDFRYTAWPTIEHRITQAFGARPDYYGQWGLPGHEGIDIASPLGTAYFAPAGGVVIAVRSGSTSAYGTYIIIDHQNGYTTLMAHMQANPPVSVGQTVIAGQLVGYSGNTGRSDGPHNHLTLKKEGYVHPGWESKPGYIDPAPFLMHLYNPASPPPPPPPGTGPIVDLSGYLMPSSQRPRLYEVETKVNGVGIVQQRHQSHRDGMGNVFYHTKGGDGPHHPAEWEQLKLSGDKIQRYTDTSMGDQMYYTLTTQGAGLPFVNWLKRYMKAGEVFISRPAVTVFMKSNCAVVSGPANTTDYLKFVKVHPTLACYNNIILHDVIELHWSKAPDFSRVEETYFYSKDPRAEGLVGWGNNRDGRWAFVSELHEPGQRPDNVRESGCFSS